MNEWSKSQGGHKLEQLKTVDIIENNMSSMFCAMQQSCG
jgi:hypothetical protein